MTSNGPTYDGQVLFVRTTRCSNCGAIHTTSELFACDPNSTHRHMFPARAYAAHIPMQKVAPETRTTPICHACVDSLQPTITDRESYARWQDTIKRKREEQRQEAVKRTAAPKKEFTIDDLI